MTKKIKEEPKKRGRKPKAEAGEKTTREQSVKPFPIYEHAQVIEVLSENTPIGFNHCRMSDGTTKSVPAELF